MNADGKDMTLREISPAQPHGYGFGRNDYPPSLKKLRRAGEDDDPPSPKTKLRRAGEVEWNQAQPVICRPQPLARATPFESARCWPRIRDAARLAPVTLEQMPQISNV